MNKYKVCVYAITKNEEKFVDKWVENMSEADLIVVADTGSTDGTIEKLRQKGVVVESIEVVPWRFDTARNMSMDLIPEDVDVCVCTDLDEMFDPGWRGKIEQVWEDTATRLRHNFTFGYDAAGKSLGDFVQEKIHARHGFAWIYPVHEVLEYTGDAPDHYVTDMRIHKKHYPDNNKSRGQYLPLLELSAKYFPMYDRNIHYLGREYYFHNRYQEAIYWLENHLSLPSANWVDERCASMRYIAKCYLGLEDRATAKKWLYRAIGEAPHLREPYLEMAQISYGEQNWYHVLCMVTEALKIPKKAGTYLDLPKAWDGTLYDLGAIAAYYMGLKEVALQWGEEAVRLESTNERLRNNLGFYRA